MDLDNGIIPMVEFPDGKILTESAIIMDYAEAHTHKGFHLSPANPLENA